PRRRAAAANGSSATSASSPSPKPKPGCAATASARCIPRWGKRSARRQLDDCNGRILNRIDITRASRRATRDTPQSLRRNRDRADRGEVVPHGRGGGMVGAERLLADRQGALEERPRRGEMALRLKQVGEIVEARRSIRVL